MKLFREARASVEISSPVNEAFSLVVSHPRDQGMATYELLAQMQRDLARLSQSKLRGMLTSAMVGSGDPAFEFRAASGSPRNRATWEANEAKTRNDGAMTMELEAKLELEPFGVVATVFTYAWPRGQGEDALQGLLTMMTPANVKQAFHSLVKARDASALQACGMALPKKKSTLFRRSLGGD